MTKFIAFGIPVALSVGFIVQVVFVLLKISGMVDWSWLIVAIPFLVYLAIALLATIASVIILALSDKNN